MEIFEGLSCESFNGRSLIFLLKYKHLFTEAPWCRLFELRHAMKRPFDGPTVKKMSAEFCHLRARGGKCTWEDGARELRI